MHTVLSIQVEGSIVLAVLLFGRLGVPFTSGRVMASRISIVKFVLLSLEPLVGQLQLNFRPILVERLVYTASALAGLLCQVLDELDRVVVALRHGAREPPHRAGSTPDLYLLPPRHYSLLLSLVGLLTCPLHSSW